MQEKAWAYYSSAADDEITLRENHAAYHRFVVSSYISPLVSLTRFVWHAGYGSDLVFYGTSRM